MPFIWIAGVSGNPSARTRAGQPHVPFRPADAAAPAATPPPQVVRRMRKRLGIPGPDRPVIDAIEERREERRKKIRGCLCGDAGDAAGGETAVPEEAAAEEAAPAAVKV